MKKNLTVVVPLYLPMWEANEIIDLATKHKSKKYDLIFINDKYNNEDLIAPSNVKVINNNQNMGKFWSVMEALEDIGTDYFLTVDPDDIFAKKIKWRKLDSLAREISNSKEEFDYGINSYAIIDGKKTNRLKGSSLITYFNPNMIMNKNNMLDEYKSLNIKYNDQKLTFFDDVLFLLLSNGLGRKKVFNHTFYAYTKFLGVTSNWENFYDEIIEAKKIMDIIVEAKGKWTFEQNIINRRINSVNNRYEEMKKKGVIK